MARGAAALLLAAAVAACGAGGAPATPTPPAGITTAAPGGSGVFGVVPPGDASGATNDAFAIDAALANVVAALQSRDAAELRAVTGTTLAGQLQDADYARIAGCLATGTTVQIEQRETLIDGDTATVTVGFAVTTNGTRADVQRVWTFARQSGNTWKLGAVPDCP